MHGVGEIMQARGWGWGGGVRFGNGGGAMLYLDC